MGLPTVREVWRLALPAGTELANVNGDLARTVSWARRLKPQPPAFVALEMGELALVPADTVHSLSERLTQAKIVGTLAERKAAAIVVAGEIPPRARAVADANDLCTFSLPADADLLDVEKDVIRFIVEREAQLDRRGRQIYRQLAQLSLEDRGLPTIARAIRQIAGDSVVIQDDKMAIQALSLTDDFPLLPETLEEMLSDTAIPLRQWLTNRHLDSKAPPCTCLDLDDGWKRCVAAIVIEGKLGGYLSIIGSADTLDDLDRLAAERGALVCAVELAKRRAVEAAEQRLKGDFFDMILTAGATEEPALTRRAREMGYELNRQHIVALIGLKEKRTPQSWTQIAGELRTSLIDAGIQVFFCPHEENLAILCSANDADLLKSLEQHIQVARQHIAETAPETRITVGIGWPGARLAGLRRSFAQAQEALTLARTLFGGDRVLLFGDLGLYHLLCRLQSCDELDEFYKQTLAPLVEYDTSHNTQLVSTLEAFFAHHGNASQTAESLYLHRNSLLYRLERIREISGLNLDDADDRFSLQLALKLRPLLPSSPNP